MKIFKRKTPRIQTDFTTLIGAATALDNQQLKKYGLPFSKLLNISHFVENIVLNSNIYFEYGNSVDWKPYRLAFEKSDLAKIVFKNKNIFKEFNIQIDEDEQQIADIFKHLIYNYKNPNIVKSLYFASKFRNGAYNLAENIVDEENPTLTKYLAIAKDYLNEKERSLLEDVIMYFQSNLIGKLGIGIYARVNLIQNFINNKELTIYEPHYSRQPLVASFSNINIHSWNMEQIKSKRKELLLKNTDHLGEELSPIFIACLSKAKKPMDIIENALKLRETQSAKLYRKECDKLILLALNGDFVNYNLFKYSINERIKDINEYLLTNGISEKIRTNLEIKTSTIPIGGKYIIEKEESINNTPGNKSFSLLSNTLKESIGILSVEEKISEIFDMKINYDINLFTYFKP